MHALGEGLRMVKRSRHLVMLRKTSGRLGRERLFALASSAAEHKKQGVGISADEIVRWWMLVDRDAA
jgi:hypothetical protein